jgi:hypothetical protein
MSKTASLPKRRSPDSQHTIESPHVGRCPGLYPIALFGERPLTRYELKLEAGVIQII